MKGSTAGSVLLGFLAGILFITPIVIWGEIAVKWEVGILMVVLLSAAVWSEIRGRE